MLIIKSELFCRNKNKIGWIYDKIVKTVARYNEDCDKQVK